MKKCKIQYDEARSNTRNDKTNIMDLVYLMLEADSSHPPGFLPLPYETLDQCKRFCGGGA